ncbi:MAG: cellulase family glycosylhydrolase [Bacteroidales bacterium]|jgi:hypothetical protein|nr:cellulase family glycosylhydrolase [Bacteroidales bacterium]
MSFKSIIITAAGCICSLVAVAGTGVSCKKDPVYFGVNYTLPFAYAFRALIYTGTDPKKAIDEDTYHFARLGLNAYRIHIWDVEITDHEGNLLDNGHLNLLDYLIYDLEKRGIHVILTTQSGWGNGYPEHNIRTEGFGYDFPKDRINEDKKAIEIQKHYVTALLRHVNPYTGRSYGRDEMILGFEIGNEPMLNGSPEDITGYINGMYDAIRAAGCDKPVFNNISQNPSSAEAILNSKVQGTTYQWYPAGLVAGHTRHGNFLPNVDDYNIPFSSLSGFLDKKRMIYEFDAADLTYSYMYPAIARSFRSAGFFWMTQFAYDPMEIAWSNTEYQTHFLNLAYTPSKAVSLKIAAEAAKTIRSGADFGKFPGDTIFKDFRVSYYYDLSELNSPEKFFYSNNTSVAPCKPSELHEIAGCGSSPAVKYEGTGAYFLDKLDEGVWRLEVMPDAIPVADPFATPSLNRKVTVIAWRNRSMKLSLPDLGESFAVSPLNKGNIYGTTASGGSFGVRPGVYLIAAKGAAERASKWTPGSEYGTIKLGEFAAPGDNADLIYVSDNSDVSYPAGRDIKIRASVCAPFVPDSVVIYDGGASFWNLNNFHSKMKKTGAYDYEAIVPSSHVKGFSSYDYYITVYGGGGTVSFPGASKGAPFDWDFAKKEKYTVSIVSPEDPLILVSAYRDRDSLEVLSGRGYGYDVKIKALFREPAGKNGVSYYCDPLGIPEKFFFRMYVGYRLKGLRSLLYGSEMLYLDIGKARGIDSLSVGLVSKNGSTYSKIIDLKKAGGIIKIPLDSLSPTATDLIPAQYPGFMRKTFLFDDCPPFDAGMTDAVVLSTPGKVEKPFMLELSGMWIE